MLMQDVSWTNSFKSRNLFAWFPLSCAHRAKTAPGIHRPLKVGTLLNVLSMLGRVLTLAVESGELEKNPCRNLKRLLNRVERQQTEEVSQVDAWSRA